MEPTVCPEYLAQRLQGDELGYRLAGLIDGEGCFSIVLNRGGATLRSVFVMGLRRDDRGILELMRNSTGLGELYDTKPGLATLAKRPGTNPQTHWRVDRKADVLAFCVLLDEYPPLSRKATEFRLWRTAAHAWQEYDWDLMRACRETLMLHRRYQERQ